MSDNSPDQGPREFWLALGSTDDYVMFAPPENTFSKFEYVHVIEKSAYDALMATHEEAVEASHKLLNERAYELDQLKSELEKAKQTELLLRAAIEGYIGDLKFYDKMWKERDAAVAERDEWIARYRNIELANKEMSRNDHVVFGELLIERDRYREALERIMIATGTSTEAHHIARAALQPKGSEG